MKGIVISLILSFVLISNVYAEVKLANGDQFGPAMDDFMNSLSDNEQRALEVGTRRLGLTQDEVKVLISSIRSGSKFTSVDQINQIFKSNDGDNTTSNYVNNNDYSKDRSNQATKDSQQDQTIDGKLDKSAYSQDKADQTAKDSQQDQTIDGKLDKSAYSQDRADQTAKDSQQDQTIDGKLDKSAYSQDRADQTAKDSQQDQTIEGKLDKSDYSQDRADQTAKDSQQDQTIDGKLDKSAYSQDRADQTAKDGQQDQTIEGKLDKSAYSQDRAVQTTKDHQQDLSIAEKVDKSDFLTEKAKQELALKDEIANRANVDSKHDKALTEHDRLINQTQSNVDNVNNKVTENTSDIKQLGDNKANKETVIKAQNRADEAWRYADENYAGLQKERDLRAEGDSRTLNKANNYTDSKFGELSEQVDSNRKKASAGIAGVAAMANIPQVSQNSTFSVGVGVGHYDSEQAMALGVSSRINGNIVTKTSFSKSSQHELVFGAGASYEW